MLHLALSGPCFLKLVRSILLRIIINLNFEFEFKMWISRNDKEVADAMMNVGKKLFEMAKNTSMSSPAPPMKKKYFGETSDGKKPRLRL